MIAEPVRALPTSVDASPRLLPTRAKAAREGPTPGEGVRPDQQMPFAAGEVVHPKSDVLRDRMLLQYPQRDCRVVARALLQGKLEAFQVAVPPLRLDRFVLLVLGVRI